MRNLAVDEEKGLLGIYITTLPLWVKIPFEETLPFEGRSAARPGWSMGRFYCVRLNCVIKSSLLDATPDLSTATEYTAGSHCVL